MKGAPDRRCPLVLVADDEEDILELVRMVLEEDGYEVLTAADGAKALRLANEHRPDLCVLDVMMPEVDGYDLTRVIKRDEELREIPVILLTARTEPENIARGREAGADEYLSKPFLPDELQQAVRSILSASAARTPTNGAAPETPDEIELDLPFDLEPEPAPPRASDGATVLLAGGDPYKIEVTRYRLELAGYRVTVAERPEHAVELADQLVPDVFVLDASMPDVDPEAVVRLLRSNKTTKRIPFLRMANGGPFDPQELFTRIEAELGLR